MKEIAETKLAKKKAKADKKIVKERKRIYVLDFQGDVRAGHEAIPWRGDRHPGINLTPPQAGPRTGTDRAGPDLSQGCAPPQVSPDNHHPD